MKKGCLALAFVLLAVAVLGIFVAPTIKDEGIKLLYPKKYAEVVESEAAEFDLDPLLVYAVIKTESGFDVDAESHAGAQGLMQLTPATFEWIASLYPPKTSGDVLDPRVNIHCGCALLRLLLDHFGNLDTALCAYNAGMGNVGEWLADVRYSDDGKTLHTIPYPETRHYLKKVKHAYEIYESVYAD